MARKCNASNDAHVDLAHALGYSNYPIDDSAEPYLNYIVNQHPRRGTLDEYAKLFVHVVEYFRQGYDSVNGAPVVRSINMLLDELSASGFGDLFTDTKSGDSMRRDDVEDMVMHILGTWTMMLSSFVQLPNGARRITSAFECCGEPRTPSLEPYKKNLAGLIKGSKILPTPNRKSSLGNPNGTDEVLRAAMKLLSLLSISEKTIASSPSLDLSASATVFPTSEDSFSNLDESEAFRIKATRLNAFKLHVLGAVDIRWTHNISRHMLLTKDGRRHVLELFQFPCAFDATTVTEEAVGIPSDLLQEIRESYGILFNPWPDKPAHAKFGAIIGVRQFCWCWSCSAYRYHRTIIRNHQKACGTSKRQWKGNTDVTQSEFDPRLVACMESVGHSDWAYELYPSLWSRIVVLEQHLQTSRPWSVWILFRDRRDTLQFWTFLFATIVVLLTILQVLLGIAQVVGSFRS